MYGFMDEERALYGVEPICRVLAIAPSGYNTDRARKGIRRGVRRVRKVWQPMLRDGQTVARCTVARLMAAEGLRGVVRGQRHRTTVADTTAEYA